MVTATDNEAIIQEMLQKARDAETTEYRAPHVEHQGDDSVETPMISQRMKSAGHVWIYNTQTGDPSKCNRNMLPIKLRQKWPGTDQPCFTVNDPGFRPPQGHLKCMLHTDDPKRARYDTLGLPVCPKSNMPNPFAVRQHMTHKHRVEWQVIEQERLDKERDDDRKLRETLLKTTAQAVKTKKK